MDLPDILKHDDAFRYQLLSRLQQDCDYYLGHGMKAAKHLWALNETDHIKTMKALWNSFKDKPKWILWSDILEYEKQMV